MDAYTEAGWVLDQLALRRAALKTLLHSPRVTQKRKVFALVTETLKYRPVLRQAMDAAGWAKTPESKRISPNVALVLMYDLLVSARGIQCGGPFKAAMMAHRTRLKAEFTRIKVKHRARDVRDLLPPELRDPVVLPRWVRVNRLRATREAVIDQLKEENWSDIGDTQATPLAQLLTPSKDSTSEHWIWPDPWLGDLLALPPSTDLHDHPLYLNGTLILQDWGSCLPASILGVSPATNHVIDACAAPGNKTSHLSALMGNRGRVSAFDIDSRRVNLLQRLTKLAGATNIVTANKSFLDVEISDPTYANVTHILLDPSCSGSGMVARLDGLVDTMDDESTSPEEISDVQASAATVNDDRLAALALFQIAALKHALSFPAVQRVVYSTCSVHQTENEDVVQQALAAAPDFELIPALPTWPRRGLPVFDGAEHCIRTLSREDHTIGFFVALFQRRVSTLVQGLPEVQNTDKKRFKRRKKRKTSSTVITEQ